MEKNEVKVGQIVKLNESSCYEGMICEVVKSDAPDWPYYFYVKPLRDIPDGIDPSNLHWEKCTYMDLVEDSPVVENIIEDFNKRKRYKLAEKILLNVLRGGNEWSIIESSEKLSKSCFDLAEKFIEQEKSQPETYERP